MDEPSVIQDTQQRLVYSKRRRGQSKEKMITEWVSSFFFLKICKLIPTFLRTFSYELWRHFCKGASDSLILVERSEVSKGVEPLFAEVPFNLGENCFDWLEFERIWHIEDGHNIELWIEWLDFRWLMNTELIHEKRKWLVTVPDTKLL